MSNACVDACTKELDNAGVPYKVVVTSKHVHIHYGPKHQHLHVCSATPSDRRAPLNERAQIRRELRTFGYVVADDEPVRDAVPIELVEGQPSCFSQDLAESFGKAHKDVLRAIDRVRGECDPDFDRRNFTPIEYLDPKGRKYRAYRLTRDSFSLVAMSFTGAEATAWKVRYISAFNAMEEQLRRLSAPDIDLSGIRSEIDAVVSMVADVEARLPKPQPQAVLPYWPGLSRMERRKLTRRLRRRMAA